MSQISTLSEEIVFVNFGGSLYSLCVF